MDLIVRAVDVGSGNTKYVVGTEGTDIRCASFPSIAYPSASETQAWSASERRKTVSIPIGHLFYEVGPDVHLVADSVRATQLHDEYTDTPEYMALLRGALHLMKQSRIDLLVVGLPVALLHLKKAALEKAMTGTHDVGGGKTVSVVKALAVGRGSSGHVDSFCRLARLKAAPQPLGSHARRAGSCNPRGVPVPHSFQARRVH